MLDWMWLLAATLRALLRARRDLVLENLLLRHQLSVALRTRPRPPLRWRDRLFWCLARHACADWRRHLVRVCPATVLRWHRRGWRIFCRQRPHRTLYLEPPVPTARAPTGTIRSWPVLGSFHHRDDRVA